MSLDAQIVRLREEVAHLGVVVAQLPDWMKVGPAGAAYFTRLNALRVELNDLELAALAEQQHRPALDLSVTGFPQVGRAPARFVGEFLQSAQALFSALGQSAYGKPTSRGVISSGILNETALDVVAFGAGSFIARVSVVGIAQLNTQATLGERAIHELNTLVGAGSDGPQLAVAIQALKGRVASSYAKLLGLLDAWNVDLRIASAVPGHELQRVAIDAHAARAALAVLTRLESIPVEEQQAEFPATLNAANARTGTFEADLGDEGTVSGKAAPLEVLHGAVIGEQYLFSVTVRWARDPLTQEIQMTFSLDKLAPIPRHPSDRP